MKKKLGRVLQFAVALVLLQGCASGPKFKDYAAKLPQPKQGDGRIWFYRPSKVFGVAVQPSVSLNGQKVGKAQPGGFFYTDKPAGSYEVACTTEWTHKCQLTLAAQSVKYVRLDMMIGVFVGHVIPREVDPATALKQLQNLQLMTGK